MFNFDDPQNDFESQLDTMLHNFEEGDYKEWTRFLVVISTHSDPRTGDLHIAPGNTGSVPVDELLQVIFPERFHNILKRDKKNKNILSLLACGALSSRPQSKEDVKKIASKKLFNKILCFSQPDFQPSFTHNFVMSFTLNHFIFDCINMVLILHEHQVLGAHTDIILFEPTLITTFKWTHPGARPMGNDTPCSIQCPNCHRLKTPSPKVTVDPKVIHLKCSKCSWEDKYSVPAGFEWCKGESSSNGGERGAWLFKTEKIELESGQNNDSGNAMEVS